MYPLSGGVPNANRLLFLGPRTLVATEAAILTPLISENLLSGGFSGVHFAQSSEITEDGAEDRRKKVAIPRVATRREATRFGTSATLPSRRLPE